MSNRMVFGEDEEPNPDDEPRPAANPEEDGDDWDERPRSNIARLPVPPPKQTIMPADRDQALELEEEMQLVADPKVEERYLKRGKPSQRALAALRMDGYGFPISEIARRLRYPDIQTAFDGITGALASLTPKMNLTTARDRHSMRLEALWASVFPRAVDTDSPEQLAYSKQAREIAQDIARLHGLNAPALLQVSTPESAEFDRALAAVFAQRNPDRPREIDVFDMVEGEDGVFQEKPDSEADDADPEA